MPQADNRAYNVSVQAYDQNGNVPVDINCNGWTAINVGTTVATVNGIPLNPGTPGTNNGESFSIGGNKDELFKGRININFTGAGTNSVLIIQKFYIL